MTDDWKWVLRTSQATWPNPVLRILTPVVQFFPEALLHVLSETSGSGEGFRRRWRLGERQYRPEIWALRLR